MIVLLNTIAENEKPRAINWISLQPDGAISVGLNDRTFISPTFRARNFVWNLYNRATLEYMVSNSSDALQPVPNPHLTFHPPIYFHLRANGEDELCAGFAEPRLMLHESETVPWLRFVSKPICYLSAAKSPRSPDKSTVETIVATEADRSIGIGIDFVRPDHTENPEFLGASISSAESTESTLLLNGYRRRFLPWPGITNVDSKSTVESSTPNSSIHQTCKQEARYGTRL